MIRWITDMLGTGPAFSPEITPAMAIIDVRDFVDKGGNPVEAVRDRLQEGLTALRQGRQVVVTCDYGISRSNAIASGILALHETIPLEQAVAQTMEATGEDDIKIEPLGVVRAALGEQRIAKPDGKRILVTGGRGFIGRALVARLEKFFTVFAPSRQEIDVVSATTLLDATVHREGITHIVHLANPKVYTSNKALGESLTGLCNVLDVCKQHNATFLYLSCWEVFSGYNATELVADEACPVLAKGPYGRTKVLCEQAVKMYQDQFGLTCSLVRPTTIYGPAADRPRFIYNFIEKARKGDPIKTHKYNNGDAKLDLLHIDDLVEALYRIISRDFYGKINLGSGRGIAIPDIAAHIYRAFGRNDEIQSQRIDDHFANIIHDNRLAKRALGWSPTVDFYAGLATIIQERHHAETP